MRIIILSLITVCTVAGGVAFQRSQPDNRQTLLVIKGRHCEPCEQFVAAYYDRQDPFLRDAIVKNWQLVSVFDDQRPDLVSRYRVGRRPTFLILDAQCREVHRVQGFRGSRELIRELTHKPQTATPEPELRAPDPREADDRLAERLEEANTALQEQIAEQTRLIESLNGDLTNTQQQAQRQAENLRLQLADKVEQLRSELAAVRDKPEPPADAETIPEWMEEQLQPRPPDSLSELSGGMRERIVEHLPELIDRARDSGLVDQLSGPGIGDQWSGVFGTIASGLVTVAAPQYAIPLSLLTTAAGVGITWYRRRKQNRLLGTATNPITVQNTRTATATKYVVHESDVLGEAYREAVRRVGNDHRESNPFVIEILQQVDGVAEQLAHGQRIVRRPQTAAAAETLPRV